MLLKYGHVWWMKCGIFRAGNTYHSLEYQQYEVLQACTNEVWTCVVEGEANARYEQV